MVQSIIMVYGGTMKKNQMKKNKEHETRWKLGSYKGRMANNTSKILSTTVTSRDWKLHANPEPPKKTDN